MSVVVYVFGCYCFNLVELTSVLIRTRSFEQTYYYFTDVIMSTQSIDTVSSCEIVGDDFGLLKPNSPELSTKSEVICSFSFKEPCPGTAFVISGVVLKSCERFSINILTATTKQDIALHFNPRLPQNYVVRNSKISGELKSFELYCSISLFLRLLQETGAQRKPGASFPLATIFSEVTASQSKFLSPIKSS